MRRVSDVDGMVGWLVHLQASQGPEATQPVFQTTFAGLSLIRIDALGFPRLKPLFLLCILLPYYRLVLLPVCQPRIGAEEATPNSAMPVLYTTPYSYIICRLQSIVVLYPLFFLYLYFLIPSIASIASACVYQLSSISKLLQEGTPNRFAIYISLQGYLYKIYICLADSSYRLPRSQQLLS